MKGLLTKIRLVATLGSKSIARKVTRKAILDVNLKKACATIIEPEAPMALRLLSNLLYGVTRVYTQKWDYLLSDTQAIQSSMRTIFKVANHDALIDSNAGKARPEQLILPDDPAFLVDGPLEPPPLDLDMIQMQSPRSLVRPSFPQRNSSVTSARNASSISLEVLSSIHGTPGPYQIDDYDPFREPSVARLVGVEKTGDDENELPLIQNEDLFEIDDQGEIHELLPIREGAQSVGQIEERNLPSRESAASARDSIADQNKVIDYEVADHIHNFSDHEPILSDVAATLEHMPEGSEMEISATAPQKRRDTRAAKNNLAAADKSIELGTLDISRMMADYRENMRVQILAKARVRANAKSRKNAIYYVFGTGINFVGESTTSSTILGPLGEFSGESLMAKIMGQSTESFSTGRKRPATEKSKKNDPNKRICSREPEPEPVPLPDLEPEPEPANRVYEDQILDILDYKDTQTNKSDRSVEIGREVASALRDSSALMPWNISTSIYSHQRSSIKRPGSRFTPASPLMGYGSIIPSDVNKSIDEMVTYGEDIEYGQGLADEAGETTLHAKEAAQSYANEDFEMFGPAAGVDTQTAGTSQWMREALDRESINFLGFIENTISEKMDGAVGVDSVTFKELFNPHKNSRIVAAQAFYHILSLATKHQIWVDQVPMGEPKIDRHPNEIYIGLY